MIHSNSILQDAGRTGECTPGLNFSAISRPTALSRYGWRGFEIEAVLYQKTNCAGRGESQFVRELSDVLVYALTKLAMNLSSLRKCQGDETTGGPRQRRLPCRSNERDTSLLHSNDHFILKGAVNESGIAESDFRTLKSLCRVGMRERMFSWVVVVRVKRILRVGTSLTLAVPCGLQS